MNHANVRLFNTNSLWSTSESSHPKWTWTLMVWLDVPWSQSERRPDTLLRAHLSSPPPSALILPVAIALRFAYSGLQSMAQKSNTLKSSNLVNYRTTRPFKFSLCPNTKYYSLACKQRTSNIPRPTWAVDQGLRICATDEKVMPWARALALHSSCGCTRYIQELLLGQNQVAPCPIC